MRGALSDARLARAMVIPWWWGFGMALILPLALLGFLLSGPHDAEAALVWLLPVPALIALDCLSGPERRMVPSHHAEPFLSVVLALIAILAPLNLYALGAFVAKLPEALLAGHGWGTVLDLLALRMLGGTTLCCSVIAPAHELMHRRPRWVRRVARGLLILVFSDVFYFSHGGGHHRHLGRSQDPSTARLGETYPEFFRRSLMTQWQMAFRFHPKAFRRGLLLQSILLLAYGFVFGGMAALVWLYLSWVAIRLLEAVNYFQHYGLTSESAAGHHTAWRCDGAVSFFLFLGLTRHADHHRRPMAPFEELRPEDEGPELPTGYLGTAVWVKNHSRSYGRFAQRRLQSLAASENAGLISQGHI